jgi:hypothetical protein
VALLWAASFLASEAAGLEPNGAALELAVEAAGRTVESVDVFRAALEHVVAWVHRRASDVDWSDGERETAQRDQVARWDCDCSGPLYMNAAALAAALEDGGWTVDSIADEWKRRGWMLRGRSARMYGRVQRAQVITRAALDALETVTDER